MQYDNRVLFLNANLSNDISYIFESSVKCMDFRCPCKLKTLALCYPVCINWTHFIRFVMSLQVVSDHWPPQLPFFLCIICSSPRLLLGKIVEFFSVAFSTVLTLNRNANELWLSTSLGEKQLALLLEWLTTIFQSIKCSFTVPL